MFEKTTVLFFKSGLHQPDKKQKTQFLCLWTKKTEIWQAPIENQQANEAWQIKH